MQFDWTFVSRVANIILPLLLIIQWLWDRSREEAMKNNLFGIRRMVVRLNDLRAQDVMDSIDASLATLGARRSFKEWARDVKAFIRKRRNSEEGEPLLPTLDPSERSTMPRHKTDLRK